MDSEIQNFWSGLAQQAQEGFQSGAVGIGGMELDSGEKHCRMVKAPTFGITFG
jgi:hypothetical protein